MCVQLESRYLHRLALRCPIALGLATDGGDEAYVFVRELLGHVEPDWKLPKAVADSQLRISKADIALIRGLLTDKFHKEQSSGFVEADAARSQLRDGLRIVMANI